MRIILALAGVFFVALNFYSNPHKIKRLLAAITVIGAAIAVLALAQNLFGNGKIYWLIPSRNTDGNSGTFVNHCNYGQFMNLSIAAAMGLLMVKLHEIFGDKKNNAADDSRIFALPQGNKTVAAHRRNQLMSDNYFHILNPDAAHQTFQIHLLRLFTLR